MVPSDFFFALAVSGGASREMLLELVARVLERAGCPGDGAGGARPTSSTPRWPAAARDQPVDVSFSAEAGQLRIVVSSQAGAIWQIARDIP